MNLVARTGGDTKQIMNFNDLTSALNWCEDVVRAVSGKSIWSELNTIQTSIDTKVNPSFVYKDRMPLVIINLVLRQFNLELIREKKDRKSEGER